MTTDTVAQGGRIEIVAADGTPIVATVRGAGSPLLFLHGWSLNRSSFLKQIDELSERFRCIAFDRRGFGESPMPPNLDAELADIDAAVDQLAGGPVHLLGVSQGGRLALRYAVTRPERLRSLIVQGAPIDGFVADATDDEAVPYARMTELARHGELEAMRRLWLAHPMMAAGMSPADRERLAGIVADYSGADLLAGAVGGSPFPVDVLDALTRLQLPALIITGALDTRERRAHAGELAQRIPGAEHAIIAGAGHMCTLSHAPRFNTLVRDFCIDVDAGRVSSQR